MPSASLLLRRTGHGVCLLLWARNTKARPTLAHWPGPGGKGEPCVSPRWFAAPYVAAKFVGVAPWSYCTPKPMGLAVKRGEIRGR